MLRERPLLWLQLDGPQSNGIIRAIFLWFKSWIDPVISYFQNWTIDNATNSHLTTMGLLSGVPRPYSFSYDDPDWYKWLRGAELSTSSLYGLAVDYDQVSGGWFSTETSGIATTKERINEAMYRPILKTICTSEFEVGGLLLIDKLVSLFFAPENYTIAWASGGQPGDIQVTIAEENTIALLALLSIGYLWEPNTHIIVEFSGV